MDKPNGERVASFHIFLPDNPEVAAKRNFRDYLRAEPSARQRYQDFKLQLYNNHPDAYRAYDSGKNAIIQQLIGEANLWAISGYPGGLPATLSAD